MAKAAVSPHTRLTTIHECPVMDPACEAQLRTCVKESRAFSATVLAWLGKRSKSEQAAWVQTSVDVGRVIFQPWAMEILFVLAVLDAARYSELEEKLQISSRTLSDKLQGLRAAGLVERVVYDEQPVRIEYSLTREGKRVAALATPLFAELNQQARNR